MFQLQLKLWLRIKNTVAYTIMTYTQWLIQMASTTARWLQLQ